MTTQGRRFKSPEPDCTTPIPYRVTSWSARPALPLEFELPRNRRVHEGISRGEEMYEILSAALEDPGEWLTFSRDFIEELLEVVLFRNALLADIVA